MKTKTRMTHQVIRAFFFSECPKRLAAADKSWEAPPSLSKPLISSLAFLLLGLLSATPFPRKSHHFSDVRHLPQSALQLQPKSLTRFNYPSAFVSSVP